MAVRIRDGSLYNINRSALSTPAFTNLFQVDLNVEQVGDGEDSLKEFLLGVGLTSDYITRNIGIGCYEVLSLQVLLQLLK